MCRVLGDPIRWRVVRELSVGTRCACELAEASGAAPSLLSHHLAVLRDAGVVTATRRGRWIDYTLASGPLQALGREVVGAVSRKHDGDASGAPDEVVADMTLVG